jgi:hypothetical protein
MPLIWIQILWDRKRRRKRISDKYIMRIKHIINEKERTAFGRGIARGFTSTQKGGLLGPDSAEQAIKNFFTKTGDDPKKEKPKSDVKTKNTVVTKKPADATKPTEKGKPAPAPAPAAPAQEPTQAEPQAPKPGDDFPVGYAGGEKYKVRVGDTVDYTNAAGKDRQAKVTKLLQTRDKDGDLQIELSLKGATYALDRKKITKVNGKDWKFTESKEETMSKAIKEGLADLAGRAEADHEVQMARADLYKIAKYAIKLHDMLKGVSEETGLEGWQQAKITKAADYIGSVYHNLDYDMKFGEGINEAKTRATCGCNSECGHCGGKHTMEEVGDKCECCGNIVKEVPVNEAKQCNCGPDCACGGNCGADCNCGPDCGNVKEGKSPYKKGSAKYKKHMAAKHAAMGEDAYKKSIAEKLSKKLEANVTPPTKPAKIDAKDIKAKQIKPNKGNNS